MKGALGKYRTIECRQYSSIWGCISNFCRDVSSCLNQTLKWRYLCEQRFYWSRFGKFGVTASKEDQNGTYIRNLQLGFCYPTFSRWSLIVKSYKFSIRTTEYFCHSENQANEGMNSQCLCSRGWHIMLLNSSIILFSITLKRLALDNIGWNRTERKSCFSVSRFRPLFNRNKHGDGWSASSLQGMISLPWRCDLLTSTSLRLQLKPYTAIFVSVARGRRFSFGSTSSYAIWFLSPSKLKKGWIGLLLFNK